MATHAEPLDLNGCRVLAALTVPPTPSHVVRFGGVVGLNREYAMGLKYFEVCSSTRDD